MLLDASLAFVPVGTPLSLVAGAGVDIASDVLDLAGTGSGNPPNGIIGRATLFGTDIGIGDDRPMLDVVIGTALATSTAATLNLALQGAPDNGSYAPGTWQTFIETGPLTVAQCPAGTRIARFDLAAAFPNTLPLPRFLRLYAQVPAATDFTAGTIAFAVVTMARDDYSPGMFSNYVAV